MSGNEQLEETDEEFLARLRAMREKRRAAQAAAAEAAMPKLATRVSPKLAEAVQANPGSLRLSAKAADDTVIVDRPRMTEIIEVVAVDGQGRPSLARRIDCATGERSLLEFEQGYRQPPGAVSNYDPFAALRGGDDA